MAAADTARSGSSASRFGGIIPPLISPLLDRDTLDRDGLERLLNHVIAGGVSGIFLLGTTGEGPGLSYRLRRELIQHACELVGGRVRVLVGITDTAFVESAGIAATAANCGADAVVLTAPYYFPAGQTELEQYVRRLTAEVPLPVMLYNMPSLTKIPFEIQTLQRLADCPQIVGVKDSSGDMDYFNELCRLKQERPDWSCLLGPEHLLAEAAAAGGDGGVNGGANMFPSLFAGAWRAAVGGDTTSLAEFMGGIRAVQDLYEIGKYGSRYIKATKCVLSLMGVCSDVMAEPFNHFLPPERARVQAVLDSLPSVCRVASSG